MRTKMIEHKMLHLMGGNMTAFGHDLPNGRGEAVRGPVNPRLVLDHLKGTMGIGIYPMWYTQADDADETVTWWVKWGCCDIDTGDWNEAYKLAMVLQKMGLVPHIERSRSKGWHVWVFSDGPVEAKDMRRALKVAYKAIDLTAKEANPKSEHLRADQLGNYVRLPFKAGLRNELDRQVMMYDWDETGDGRPAQVTEWFNNFDDLCRVDPSTIRYWASKWHEPPRPKFNGAQLSNNQVRKLAETMHPGLKKFLLDGPPHGHRSEGLTALGFKLKKAGYTSEEIFSLLKAADGRWGKYHERANGDVYLMDIVERTM